ncbi:hypothetical protein T07_7510, partial [Trichinella nelsoni]
MKNKRRQEISLFEVIYVFRLILVLFGIRHPYMTEWHEAYNLEKLLIYMIQFGPDDQAGYGSAEARSSYWWCVILVSDRWLHSRQMTSSRRLSDRKVKPVGNDRAETNRRLPTRPLCHKVYYTRAQFCTQNSRSLLAAVKFHVKHEDSEAEMFSCGKIGNLWTYGEQSQRLYHFAYSTVEVQIHGNLQKSIIQLRVFQSWQRETQMVTTLLFTYSQHGCDRCTVFQGLYAMYKLFKNFEQYVQLMSVTLQQTVEFWTSDEIIAAVSTQQENCRHKAFDACCNILLHKRPSLRLQRHWELMMCKSTYICPSEAASPSMEVPFVMYYSNA